MVNISKIQVLPYELDPHSESFDRRVRQQHFSTHERGVDQVETLSVE